MKLFKKPFRKGSLFLVGLYAAVALFFLVDAALGPEHRYVSLLLATAGLSGTWRQYVVWSKKRAQGGMELLGTDPRER